MTAEAPGVGSARPRASHERRATLFALTWGLVTLFHLAGNARPSFDTLVHPVVQFALGVVALVVCLAPCRRGPLLVLCALVPISAWLEAPFVGNHWVLAAALSMVYLMSRLVVSVSSRRTGRRWHAWELFAPTARLVLLGAYAFAGFAKLNSGFFDTATSCAVFYQDQIVGSWGLSQLSVEGLGWPSLAVVLAAAAVELSVPVLLVLRRSRRWGLLLALGFHWSLALDLAQHFWDFSSVLFAGFLLFADDRQVDHVTDALTRARDRTRASVWMILVTVGVAAGAVVTVSAAIAGPHPLHVVAVLLGHGAWMTLGTGILVLIAVATLRIRPAPERRALRAPAAVMLLVPVLVVFNGLTPYLELKTGFGWNMYSNLHTVGGETNHLLVPATLDLSGAQLDLVEVLETSDPALAPLIDSQYAVVSSEAARVCGPAPRRVADLPPGRPAGGCRSHRRRAVAVQRCQCPLPPPAVLPGGGRVRQRAVPAGLQPSSLTKPSGHGGRWSRDSQATFRRAATPEDVPYHRRSATSGRTDSQ